MRILIALALVSGVAACASPEMRQLRAACQDGSLEACAAAEQYRQQRAAALGMAMWQSGAALRQPAYRPAQPSIVHCNQLGQTVACHGL